MLALRPSPSFLPYPRPHLCPHTPPPTQIPGGWAAQRWGGRRTLIVSFLCWSLACLLTPGSAGSVRLIMLARVAVGLAQGGVIPSIHTVLSQVCMWGRVSVCGGVLWVLAERYGVCARGSCCVGVAVDRHEHVESRPRPTGGAVGAGVSCLHSSSSRTAWQPALVKCRTACCCVSLVDACSGYRHMNVRELCHSQHQVTTGCARLGCAEAQQQQQQLGGSSWGAAAAVAGWLAVATRGCRQQLQVYRLIEHAQPAQG